MKKTLTILLSIIFTIFILNNLFICSVFVNNGNGYTYVTNSRPLDVASYTTKNKTLIQTRISGTHIFLNDIKF